MATLLLAALMLPLPYFSMQGLGSTCRELQETSDPCDCPEVGQDIRSGDGCWINIHTALCKAGEPHGRPQDG